MEMENIFEWIRGIVCQNPFWSIVGAVFTPTAIIQLRKFYLEYYSKLEIKILRVIILPREANFNVPRNQIYFSVEAEITKKTRKLIYLKNTECRILTDSIVTRWYNTNWGPGKINLTDTRSRPVSCNFFEFANYSIYQFEIRIKEDGTGKFWTKKSTKYRLERDQLIEI